MSVIRLALKRKISTAFLLCSLVLVQSLANADAAKEFKTAADRMTSELGPQVSTQKSNFYVFHYQKKDRLAGRLPVDFVTPGSPSASKELEAHITDFEQPDQSKFLDDYFGNGLYVAFDPLSTQTFGLPDFALFVIALHKGDTYLDLTNDQAVKPFSPAVNNLARAAGCIPDPENGLDIGAMLSSSNEVLVGTDLKTVPTTQACRALGLQVLKNLGVKYFTYTYSNFAAIKGCNMTEDNFIAAVIVNRSAVTPTNVTVFSTDVTPHESPEKYVMRTEIERAARMSSESGQGGINFSLWPGLQIDQDGNGSPGLPEPISAWLKKNILYCQ